LGEIETTLLQHEQITDAVVVAVTDETGNKKLTAYFVTKNKNEIPINQLREFTGNRLPHYMVPSVWMRLEKLPLTQSGKVNRRALPQPNIQREVLESDFVEPHTIKEKTIAAIWQDILNSEKISIKDNFFELGGDSILSIQMIARARQQGIQITPKQLFENPTIEELASVAGSVPVIQAEQGLVTGPLTLTPIQRYFFEQNFSNPHHWNQSVMLEVSQSLSAGILQQVVKAIVAHHDALRLRFEKDKNNRWQGYFSEQTNISFFVFFDFSVLSPDEQDKSIKKEAERLQKSLNIWEGPLFRLAYFKRNGDRPDRLLIIIHHLAVDGVSWRILTEDIQLAYSQLINNQKINLPPKTTSFQYWAQSLEKYAHSETVQKELNFWLQMIKRKVQPLPVDFPNGNNTEKSARKVVVLLKEKETSALLQEVPSVYNTQINDALLATLLKAYSRWSGQTQIFLQLEGHGREEIADDIDISRTVGWFTTMYPVLLSDDHSTDLGQLLKSVKEQLRRVPNKGIGYGLLKYTLNNENLGLFKKPGIVFNYLGQFDQVVNENQIFRVAQDYEATERAPENHREFLIDISISVKNGRMIIQIIYNKNIHKHKTIESLASYFKEELLNLIEFCRSVESGGYTPSDFSDVKLEEDEIDDLLSELDE